MTNTEVTDLIAALAGSMSLDEVSARFRLRICPGTRAPQPKSYLELAAAAQEDPEADVPGSFDDVVAAYDRGELTWEQYRKLAHAAADAINAKEPAEGSEGRPS